MSGILINNYTVLMASVDAMRKDANSKLESRVKSEFSQFMTPAPTATFMASLFPEPRKTIIKLLDPGAGVGSLTSAFLTRIKDWDHIRKIDVDLFEIDNVMLQYLKKNLTSCFDIFGAYNLNFNYKIFYEDFIQYASDQVIKMDGLWGDQIKKYTHCIMNPPYKKISSTSDYRKLLQSAGIETVNLYSGFLALSLSLLETNGHLIAIIPRSFCNGPYYKPFREYIIKNSAIKHIHLFDARNRTFKEDDVLQENVIIMLEKGGTQNKVTVTYSTDDSFNDLITISHPFTNIIHPNDNNIFIHIPTSKDIDFISNSKNIRFSLEEIGLQVSTGPVVDFRVKDYLQGMPEKNSVPLLYPCHFSSMKIKWPIINGKKPNSIKYNIKTEKWLLPVGYYTVVRRFSSKEEKRRIIASVVDPNIFKQSKFIGIENHLNVFHAKKRGITETLALGLAVYLNSKAVDDYFRKFSGHTQVNATDLKTIKYPSRKNLMNLGKWAKQQDNLLPDMIDQKLKMLENETNK